MQSGNISFWSRFFAPLLVSEWPKSLSKNSLERKNIAGQVLTKNSKKKFKLTEELDLEWTMDWKNNLETKNQKFSLER